MKPEIKALWVEALRSGKYKQTGYTLRDGNHYCCLGVLCDLHRKQAGEGKWKQVEDSKVRNYTVNKASDDIYCPTTVLKWAGLHHSSMNVLARKNDRDGLSFQEIADYIEKRL